MNFYLNWIKIDSVDIDHIIVREKRKMDLKSITKEQKKFKDKSILQQLLDSIKNNIDSEESSGINGKDKNFYFM